MTTQLHSSHHCSIKHATHFILCGVLACFILPFMFLPNTPTKIKEETSSSRIPAVTQAIPKILHFIHVTEGLPVDQPDLPAEVTENMVHWKRLHPTWTVKLWNNSAVRDEFPDLLPIVLPIKTMAWISDLIRYHVIEKYGGIYLDTDVVPIRALDKLVSLSNFAICEKPAADQHFVKSEKEYQVDNCELVCNCVIGSSKHHPALKDVIKTALANTEKELSDQASRYKLSTSGPPVWTASAKRYNLTVLHASLFFPCSWTNKSECQIDRFIDQPHVYGMHKWKMTWYKYQ